MLNFPRVFFDEYCVLDLSYGEERAKYEEELEISTIFPYIALDSNYITIIVFA